MCDSLERLFVDNAAVFGFDDEDCHALVNDFDHDAIVSDTVFPITGQLAGCCFSKVSGVGCSAVFQKINDAFSDRLV